MFLRISIIRDFHFADIAVLGVTAFKVTRKVADHFSNTCNAFGLTISIKKMEVVHQPSSLPKQIREARPKPPIHHFLLRSKYVKTSTYLGSKVYFLVTISWIVKATNTFDKLYYCLCNERIINLDTKNPSI